MSAPEQVNALGHQDDVRAKFAGQRHRHDVLAACRLGLFGSCYDAGGVRTSAFNGEGDDANRLLSQMRESLLHDRRKEAVKVQIELFDGFRPAHVPIPI